MEIYAGLDLHSRNTYIGILDNEFNQVFKKRVHNNIEQILETLNPFRDQLTSWQAKIAPDGTVSPPDGPGLGVDVDESALDAFPLIDGPGYV